MHSEKYYLTIMFDKCMNPPNTGATTTGSAPGSGVTRMTRRNSHARILLGTVRKRRRKRKNKKMMKMRMRSMNRRPLGKNNYILGTMYS